MAISEPLRQWDIAVVPFPYSDQLAEKKRPALIVSGDEFMAETGLAWLVMVTTSREPWSSDIAIEDHSAAGLPVPSKVRVAKIATIDTSRIVRVAGRLNDEAIMHVRRALDGILGNLKV